ncbi:MAG: hypothetical protein Q9220_000516 [cf. Caloplaca sp. 1 TL-2023]
MRKVFSICRNGSLAHRKSILCPWNTLQWRFYSRLPIISPQTDKVKVNVKVGSSGSIPLRIRHPPRPSSNTPIIVYFPPSLSTKTPDESQQDHVTALSLIAHATTIHITPRLSSWPIPLHDTLAAYDWIRTHLLPQHLQPRPQIAICGSLLGGSLALTLALTECKTGGITACAAHDPIADWSSPFTTPRNHQDEVLTSMRQTLFAKAEHRYDPFASPLLFFRTPAFELPPPPSPYAHLISPGSTQASAGAGDELIPARRRYHRTYPPIDSALRIPKTRISVGKDFALRDRAVELAELMQRSVDVHERDGDSGSEQMERISVSERDSDGLGSEEREIMEMGEWLGEVLRER